ncbi:MAG: hypothetical protein WBC54_10170, partial [Rhodococcus sp. (in: high G+C Gram-positive bacteria)]
SSQTRAHSPSARTIAPRPLTIPRAPDERARIRDDPGLNPGTACEAAANRECKGKRARIRHPRAQSHPDRSPFPAHPTNARAFAVDA